MEERRDAGEAEEALCVLRSREQLFFTSYGNASRVQPINFCHPGLHRRRPHDGGGRVREDRSLGRREEDSVL